MCSTIQVVTCTNEILQCSFEHVGVNLQVAMSFATVLLHVPFCYTDISVASDVHGGV